MQLEQYVVDAFTREVFQGNPAAVCVLNQWLPESMMLAIARENNLSETAFAVKGEGRCRYGLRWFTPGGEIDLCGHATLATAYVVLSFYEPGEKRVTFSTKGGELAVVCRDGLYEMDFPAYELVPVPVTPQMTEVLGATPLEAYLGRDLLCVLDSAQAVHDLAPDLEKAKELEGLLLHVTAAGDGEKFNCVSRSFAPKLGIAEDPVCGSGHCHIVPFWAGRLGRADLVAYQASPRGGELYCRAEGDRVILAGHAALYSTARINVPTDDRDAPID